jgi:hypothetical protein
MAKITIRAFGYSPIVKTEAVTVSEAIAIAEQVFKLPKRQWGYTACLNGRLSYGQHATLSDGDVVAVSPTPSVD